jgi:hypothetical protein
MATLTHIAARLPLRRGVSEGIAIELAEAIEALTNIQPTGPGEAIPCRIGEDLTIATAGLPRWSHSCFRILPGEIHMCGSMIDLDRCLTWNRDGVEYVSGTPIMAELMTMLTQACEAPVGTIIGSMCIARRFDYAGPIVMTADGVRWCPSGTDAGHRPVPRLEHRIVTRLPPETLITGDVDDARCHVGIDRRALRTHLRFEGMTRARTPTRISDSATPEPEAA